MKIRINHLPTDLNTYIKAERSNRYIGAKIKKQETEDLGFYFLYYKNKIKKLKFPVKIKIIWHLKNKRKDLDNVAFAIKFIQDALVKIQAIENDGQKYINCLEHSINITPQEGFEIEFIEN